MKRIFRSFEHNSNFVYMGTSKRNDALRNASQLSIIKYAIKDKKKHERFLGFFEVMIKVLQNSFFHAKFLVMAKQK